MPNNIPPKVGIAMGIMDPFDSSGNVVLVTGAGADLDGPAAPGSAERVGTLGARAIAADIDVAQEASIRDLVGAMAD